MKTEEIIAEILKKSNIDIKEIERSMKQNDESQEPKKIRLAPLSFGKVSNFFTKARQFMLTKKIDAKQAELDSYKKDIVEVPMSEHDVQKVAMKMARLEGKIKALQYRKRVSANTMGRALKLKQEMLNNMEYHSGELYKFTANPFENKTSEKKSEKLTISLEDQLDQKLNDTKKEEEKVISLNDFAKSTKERKQDTTTLSIEEQLDQELSQSNQKKSSLEDTTYNLSITPEDFDKIKKERKDISNRYLGNYHLKKDQIIQDEPINAVETQMAIPALPEADRGYHGIMAGANERSNVSQAERDYLNSHSYTSPTLEDEKRALEREVASRNNIYGDDYIRADYQKQLDRVTELIEQQAGSTLRSSNSVNVRHNDEVVEPLEDLIKLAEEEEKRAQEIADQARLAKEEALQAAREKEEKERLSAATDERYGQLLNEAKLAIEARSQRARSRMEQEQAELERNKNLTAGIRRDAQAIDAKVAQRQNEISQLESVLGQYRNESSSTMKR